MCKLNFKIIFNIDTSIFVIYNKLMNTRILCFGDSNTWGHIPNTTNDRYSNNIRWSSRLANKGFDIIEYSMDGLTLNCKNAPKERIGLDKLKLVLSSDNNFDYIIIQLGLNDLLVKYNTSINSVLGSYTKLLDLIKYYKVHNNDNAKLILIGIHHINENVEFARKSSQYIGINDKIITVNKFLRTFCLKHNLIFIDTSNLLVGLDGVHFTKESHYIVYQQLIHKIKEYSHDNNY